MALGVVPEFARSGLAPALVTDLGVELMKKNYTLSTVGWTLEDNDAVNHLATDYGCKRSAVHRMYEKSLGA